MNQVVGVRTGLSLCTYQILYSYLQCILSVLSGLCLCSVKIVHLVASEQCLCLKFRKLMLHYRIVAHRLLLWPTIAHFLRFRKNTAGIFCTCVFRFFVFRLRDCMPEHYSEYCVIFQILWKGETGLLLFRLIFLIFFHKSFKILSWKSSLYECELTVSQFKFLKSKQNLLNQLLINLHYKIFSLDKTRRFLFLDLSLRCFTSAFLVYQIYLCLRL